MDGKKDHRDWGLSTQAVHAGEESPNPYGSITTPIVQTSAYTFPDTSHLETFMARRREESLPPYQEYGRYGNPTARALERKLAALEGGEDAVLLASGMAAVTMTLLTLLRPGDHLIVTQDAYRKTRAFCTTFLRRWQVDVSVLPAGDYEGMEAAITPRTRFIYSETPTNPFLRVLDLERVAEIARRHGLTTIIDSTFATPYNLRPRDFGIDVVIHSVTKYLAGHNDVLAGVVIGPREVVDPIREARGTFGSIVDPGAAYLILRGLKTLTLRVRQQNHTALALARFLEQHPRIRRVWYPGLPSHPDHTVATRLMRGFGGVVSFEIEGTGAETRRFVDALRIPRLAPSLGGVESLVTIPSLMSYYDAPAEERERMGISDRLVRFAVGVEDTEDILADVDRALACLKS